METKMTGRSNPPQPITRGLSADAALATALRCPACDRRLGDAETARNLRLRCKSCGATLLINVSRGALTVAVENWYIDK